MKRGFLVLTFCAALFASCNNNIQAPIYEMLPENVYSEGEFEFSKWGGYRWFVIPIMNASQQYCSKYMYIDGTEADLPVILGKVIAELGEPIAQQVTNPEPLLKYTSVPHVFALPNNRELEETETLYWWDSEEYVVSLLESKEHPEVEMVAYAIVALYDKRKLP